MPVIEISHEVAKRVAEVREKVEQIKSHPIGEDERVKQFLSEIAAFPPSVQLKLLNVKQIETIKNMASLGKKVLLEEAQKHYSKISPEERKLEATLLASHLKQLYAEKGLPEDSTEKELYEIEAREKIKDFWRSKTR
ncbi:MAG: hypothetical protein ACP5O3_00755 [Candidatus Micrarchaeia archaeon]|jgi:hypothetical protein